MNTLRRINEWGKNHITVIGILVVLGWLLNSVLAFSDDQTEYGIVCIIIALGGALIALRVRRELKPEK